MRGGGGLLVVVLMGVLRLWLLWSEVDVEVVGWIGGNWMEFVASL